MLETLKLLLQMDLPAPSIMLEEDGCLNLEWYWDVGPYQADPCVVDVSIWPDGKVSWACANKQRHGADIDKLKELLGELTQ